MKKIVLIAVVFMASLFANQPVRASHFAGADLTYTCLGGNTYLISMSFTGIVAVFPPPDPYKSPSIARQIHPLISMRPLTKFQEQVRK